MSKLVIFDEQGQGPKGVVADHAEIAERLGSLGVRFERWPTDGVLGSDAGQEEVLAVYQGSVNRLNNEYGFQSVDVVALRPQNPKKEELRAKFLKEHVHDDFEVRFFVDGKGLFYLHVGEQVWLVLCEQGDLISVPAGTKHWFDMGANPDFKCIRLFVVPEGWQGRFSGSDIESHFPDYDQFLEACA